MKKKVTIILVMVFCSLTLFSCSGKEEYSENANTKEDIKEEDNSKEKSMEAASETNSFLQIQCNEFLEKYSSALSSITELYFVENFQSNGMNFHKYQSDPIASVDGSILALMYDESDIAKNILVYSPVGSTSYFYVYNAISSVNPNTDTDNILLELNVTKDGIREDGRNVLNLNWANLVFEQKEGMTTLSIMFYE